MKKSKHGSNSLKERMERSHNTRERGGNTHPQAFNWRKAKNVKFYTLKEGKNLISVVPYIVKTKNDPLVHSGDAEIGDQSYMFDIYLHTYVGPMHAEIICPKSNYGKPCPICQKAQEFKDKGKTDEASDYWPSRWCYYNIIDEKEPKKGLQVLGIKFNKFEKPLISASYGDVDEDDDDEEKSNNGDHIDFVDIDDGKAIYFRGEEVTKLIKGKTSTYLEFVSFKFKERTEPLDPDLINDAVSFDELAKIQSADEIEKLLYGEDGGDEDSTDEEEAPEDSDDDDDDEDDEKPEKKTAAKKAPAKKTAKDDDEDDDEDDDDEDSEDGDEDDEEDEDTNDDDDDEDDEKPEKKTAAKKAPAKETKKAPVKIGKAVCPHKHKFGIDTDKKDECEDCDSWADCTKEKTRLKKAK